MINKCIIYKFFKDFPNHRKKTNRAVVFSCRPTFSPTFLSTGTTNETFQQSEKQVYMKVQLVYMKVQAHSSLESLLESNQDQTSLANQDSL